MSKEPIEHKLPKSWIWSNLGGITLTSTKTNKKNEKSDKEFLYIDINAIDNETFKITAPKLYTWGSAPSRAQQIIKENDIVFSTVRPYLKNIAFVKKKYHDEIASTGFCVIRPVLINPKYVFYYVLSNKFINEVNSLAKGTSYPAVTNKVVFNQKIPIPPLNEQQRIVYKIEELLSELDNSVANLKLVQSQIKVYRQALLKHAFSGKLTESWRRDNHGIDATSGLIDIQTSRKQKYNQILNEGSVKKPKADFNFTFKSNKDIPSWADASLDNLIGINARIGWKGLTKKEYTKEGPLLLSVHALNYGKNVVFKDANHITVERYEESPEIKLQLDYILLCKDGAGIGKVGIIKNLPDKATVNSSLLVIDAKEVFNPDFLYYFFLGPTMQKLVNEKISGSAIPHLFQKDIKKFNLKVPPKQEQNRIVEILESRFTLIEHLEKSIDNCLKDSTVLRNSILKKAFEGKLVNQDSNDEPAIKLLQKIRAEKEIYHKALKELDKLKPKKKRQMETKKTVLEILKESNSPISAQELWTNSIHQGDIESFYEEIKEIHSKLIEVKENTESLLSLKK